MLYTIPCKCKGEYNKVITEIDHIKSIISKLVSNAWNMT